MTSYSDQSYSTKTLAASSGLSSNPATRTGGVIAPSLNLVIGPLSLPSTTIYLVAETDTYNNLNVKSVITVIVDMCSDEPKPVSVDPVAIPEGSNTAIKLLPLFKFTPTLALCMGYELILSTTNQPTAAVIAPFAIANDELTITAPII